MVLQLQSNSYGRGFGCEFDTGEPGFSHLISHSLLWLWQPPFSYCNQWAGLLEPHLTNCGGRSENSQCLQNIVTTRSPYKNLNFVIKGKRTCKTVRYKEQQVAGYVHMKVGKKRRMHTKYRRVKLKCCACRSHLIIHYIKDSAASI